MKRIFLLSLILLVSTVSCNSPFIELRCDESIQPVGVDPECVIMSWACRADKEILPGTYRLVVASSEKNLDAGNYDMWDTGKVEGSQFSQVCYAGKPLDFSHRYFWKVKVSDISGKMLRWSENSSFVTMLDPQEWNCSNWIGYEAMPAAGKLVPGVHALENHDNVIIEKTAVVPYLRKTFETRGEIREAYLSVSGLGHYEFYINGVKVSPFLTPGWSLYEKQVLFNTYDVTELLEHRNVLASVVGNGFHYINNQRYLKLNIAYGYPKLNAVLKIRYVDGREENIVTDGTWKTTPSPIRYSSIYGGEDFDARAYDPSWNSIRFDDSSWTDAQIVPAPEGKMQPDRSCPITVREELDVKTVHQLSEDCYTYDFGQNASGIIEVTLEGHDGDTVRFWPAELLHADKTVNQRASGAPYYYEYILKGNGPETWRPAFTYYGFRYVMVEHACPQQSAGDTFCPVIQELKFLHTCASAEKVGTFECSSQLMNQIYDLIDWAIRSNMQSVMTDCPHREKLGWLEQSHLMGNSIRYNYNIYHQYRKMVDDMMASQRENGLVPDIAPEYVHFAGGFVDSPEWGSASVLVPWSLYKWYGDQNVLEKAYPMMQRYVAYLSSKSDGHILSHGLGDWFDYGPAAPGEAQLTPKSLTATAFYYKDVQIMEEVAALLGKQNDFDYYSHLTDEIAAAFQKEFYDPELATYATGSQTALSIPLCLGLVPEKEVSRVRQSLLDCVRKDNYALTAGDIGFHYLVSALSVDAAASEVLYRMVNRSDVPGYGFQLAKGATALTESWPALEQVSNNHLMLGHIMEWFYSGLLGLNETASSIASSEVLIAPKLVGDLTWAKGSYLSPKGKISVNWQRQAAEVHIQVEIPAGIKAVLEVPEICVDAGRILELESGVNEFIFVCK